MDELAVDFVIIRAQHSLIAKSKKNESFLGCVYQQRSSP